MLMFFAGPRQNLRCRRCIRLRSVMKFKLANRQLRMCLLNADFPKIIFWDHSTVRYHVPLFGGEEARLQGICQPGSSYLIRHVQQSLPRSLPLSWFIRARVHNYWKRGKSDIDPALGGKVVTCSENNNSSV
jgi:hypothetical protein